MSRVVFASWHKEPATAHSAKVKYFNDRSIEVNIVQENLTVDQWLEVFDKAGHVFLYNGFRPEAKPIREAALQCGKPFTYWEGGILPARAHEFLDREGVLGGSSFCRDISWVTEDHVKKLISWKHKYIESLGIKPEQAIWEGGDYIFAPMQCYWDANFNPEHGWSPFTGKDAMIDFIAEVQRLNPSDRIIFRCHPADIKRIDEYASHVHSHNDIIEGSWASDYRQTEGQLIRQILGAKKVVGINSTCLLQSVLFKVPTEALGFGYVKAAGENWDDRIRMVAACWSRSFRWSDKTAAYRVMDEVHPQGTVFWR